MKNFIISILLLFSILLTTVDAEALSKQQKQRAKHIANVCTQHYEKYHILPSTAVSMAFEESTLGKETVRPNNLWGIKTGDCKSWRSFSSLTEGTHGYLKTLQQPRYKKARKQKNALSQVNHILKGGYCDDYGYFKDVKYLYNKYNLAKYDKKLKRKMSKKRQKRLQKHIFTLKYSPKVTDNRVIVNKKIIPKGTICIYSGYDLLFISDVKGGSKGFIILVGDKKYDGLKVRLEVYQNAKG